MKKKILNLFQELVIILAVILLLSSFKDSKQKEFSTSTTTNLSNMTPTPTTTTEVLSDKSSAPTATMEILPTMSPETTVPAETAEPLIASRTKSRITIIETPTMIAQSEMQPTPPPVDPYYIPAWDRNYYGEGLPPFYNQNKDLLQIIKECKEYYAYNGFNYCMCSGKRRIPPENSFKTSCSQHGVKNSYVTDCSTYVSWVLHEYGSATGNFELANHFSSQKNSGAFHKIAKENGGQFFDVIQNLWDCKPGDILIYSGHVEFFQEFDVDGRAIVWSCGSGNFVNHEYPEKSRKTSDKITGILRLKQQ